MAYAKQADVAAALTYLRRARTEFAAADGTEVAPWAAFFGANDMAAMAGTVHGELAQVIDVRHGRDGIRALTDAIAGYGPDITRSRGLTVIWLATAHALDGHLDVAAGLGQEAIELAGALRSPRTLSAAARRFSGDAHAREIVGRIDELPR